MNKSAFHNMAEGKGPRAFAGSCSWLALCLVLACSAPAAAQADDVTSSARAAAARGQRAEALTSLEAHLGATPRDVDARLLYGLILSWEGRYEEARRELRAVLVQAPGYVDARVALMNVAWWSGATSEARDAAVDILSRDPGNQSARDIRERLEAASRPWWVGFTYSHDSFSDGRNGWHESATSVTRLTGRGSLSVRANEARRFGLGDRLFEVEAYPRLRTGTYAYVGVGATPQSVFYPSHRLAFDLYQSAGGGFEISGGYRRLAFAEATSIYVGTVTKYTGQWMITGKVFRVPAEGDLDSTSYHATVRRYVRDEGLSYIGATYSHGFSREEIRNLNDLATLNSDTIRVDVDQQFAGRWRVFGTAGTSRQERMARVPLWQTSTSAGLMVRF
jgi:YaiO family outer membrane protein